jgi:hypothetical protein
MKIGGVVDLSASRLFVSPRFFGTRVAGNTAISSLVKRGGLHGHVCQGLSSLKTSARWTLNEGSRLISDAAFHDLTIAECTCQISNMRGGYVPCRFKSAAAISAPSRRVLRHS